MILARRGVRGSPSLFRHWLHTTTRARDGERFNSKEAQREQDFVDVCIVGAGPAGLSAAIRLKQLEKERGDGREIRVVVLEKGSEVGAHTLSGAVIEPRALNELLPDWENMEGRPQMQPATSSRMRWFTKNSSFPMPHPPAMSNKGNYILSLSQFTAWLGSIAEELGVEVYPGFGGAGLVYGGEDSKQLKGVYTNAVGLDKEGRMTDSFDPGMQFNAKVTLLAEGAHGSLTKQLVKHFGLRKEIGADEQTYGIGVKEVWRVAPEKHRPGEVLHTMGWPLDWRVYGGGWIYHMADSMVSLGLVIGLDYANPYISPYRELQRMKHHPYFRNLLEGGERIAYGGRVINEGGLQSLPRLHFPGGALIGCSAGLVNVPKIKGTHNAMKSGMLAAETAFAQLDTLGEWGDEGELEKVADMSSYETSLKDSWVWKELHEVRNLRPSFNTPLGIWGGMAYSGVDSLFLKGRVPWTFRNKGTDAGHTAKASEFKPIEYPAPEAPLSTDIMTSVSLTSTNHAEEQPVHLQLPYTNVYGDNGGDNLEKLAEEARTQHVKTNVGEFAGLLGRACPAGVYEYVDAEKGEPGSWEGKKLVINSQNCIHCKLCDIKVPTQDITWTVPEGGGGPKYSIT
ncbi:hypothetical protein M408DRAFT_29932 [Serendipita vermifera MAFF 305830]|uniref:Electron transfer flavoprotein-ubiquinone oxidoreductase n=1 Tax=Serendipita vermifera MAFF 305830 TaxID=933852 RepID=A0A0C3A8I2_SERVB|nr:hypothetical protein M408DRAFT_29932 [Serendipita vermifera MAFF 305830]